MLDKGCRVRVKCGRLGGVGTITKPALEAVPYSRISVVFDDSPGFEWQFEQDEVRAL